MSKKTIGIVGQGFVGNALREGFNPYYDVHAYDKYIKEKSTTDQLTLVQESDFIFVCVPTPMTSAGECYTGIVEDVLREINAICVLNDIKDRICIIKSTVIPGTTKKMNDKFSNLNVIFSPEFLTEANAVEDFKNQTRIVLGGLNKVTAKVKPIFAKAFPKVPIIKTDSMYAELVKYVTNTFLATKVSFANEIYEICQKLGVDYDKVIEYAQHDDRLGNSHWSVPGPDGELGYGGHCFPKDTQALFKMAHDLGVNPIMLASTITKNDEVREDRDWESMEGRAVINVNTNFTQYSEHDSIESMRSEHYDPNQLEFDFPKK